MLETTQVAWTFMSQQDIDITKVITDIKQKMKKY